MTLAFLGTRANIGVRSTRHRRHTATLVLCRGARILVDCGADWLDGILQLRPSAIVITHAHADHVDGLRHGAPCPVYATDETWARMRGWPIGERARVVPRVPFRIGGVELEGFPVEHSIRAPALGYRMRCAHTSIFYVPDVLEIVNRAEALDAVALYVGDGATVSRPIVRRRDGASIGHASVAAQLDWCARAHVSRAVFTHCGTAVVGGGAAVETRVRDLGRALGVVTTVAEDGRRMVISRRRRSM